MKKRQSSKPSRPNPPPTKAKPHADRKKEDNTGKVYYGKTKYIDTDNKPRRRFAVTKDNGDSVKVAKIGSLKQFDKDGKNINPDFVEIKPTYNGLTERTGVFNREYGKNRITKEPLRLGENNGVFDDKELFTLDVEDLGKVQRHLTEAKSEKRKQSRKRKSDKKKGR